MRHKVVNNIPISTGYAQKIGRATMIEYLHCEKYGLPSRLIVHHRDENVNNNDISNLQLITRGQHVELHRGGRGKYGVRYTGNELEWNRAARAERKRERDILSKLTPKQMDSLLKLKS